MNEGNPHAVVNHGFVIAVSCIATIGGFLFGFDSGVINGTVDGLRQAFNSDSVGTGFNVASMLLGCAAGASTAEFWWGYQAWRWMFWVEMAPAAVFFVALLFIPESPRYLVASGKKDRAQGVLARIYGEAAAHQKVDDIYNSLAADHHRPKLRDLLDSSTGKVRKIVWVGIGLASFQRLVGINVVFLLRSHTMAGSRLLRIRCLAHQCYFRGGQYRRRSDHNNPG